MIWSIFNTKKEPSVLINELLTNDTTVNKAAYHALLDHPDEEADDLMLVAVQTSDINPIKKRALVSILGHRATEQAIPLFEKYLASDDKELKNTVIEALFDIGLPESIDLIIKNLRYADDDIKHKTYSLISKLPENDAMGSLIRCIPEDKNSTLYFEIATLMEELQLFDSLKANFDQPDPMVKKFYFDTIIKFDRPDFIPLYLDYYPSASLDHREIILDILSDSEIKDLLANFNSYLSRKGVDGVTSLIDKTILNRYNEASLDILKFIISIKDSKYRVKVLPNLLKHIDPYAYDTVFDLLKEGSYELRELASNSLVDLIRRTYKRINDYREPNKTSLDAFIDKWKKSIKALMISREELPDDFYKSVRKIFFEFCNFDHEMLQPIVLELVRKDFFETYYLLKDWSFEDKFRVYSWMLKTEPAIGSIILSSLTARADDTLWRLAIKLSKAFDDEEDSEIYRKNLVMRHSNLSFEKFLKDEDAGVRAAAVEIIAKTKTPGYADIVRSYVKDPDTEVRIAALKSMLDDKLLSNDKLIMEALDDPKEEVVLFVLKKLKPRIGAQKLSPFLVRYVNSNSQELRSYAIQEIAAITKERYKVNFNNMTPDMRKLAAQAIQKIDTNFTDEVIADLGSFDPQTRLKAALLLENIQIDTKGQNALISAMKDPSKKVRAAIVKTLGIVGDSEVIKHLISFFNDPDPRVRANTVEAIASLGDSNVVRVLLPYLEDSNNRIRANAIVGICKFGKFNVAPVLQSMLSDADVNMKASALWAIGEIGEPVYLPFTYQFMQDKNELLRYNAIKTISRINPQLLSPYMAALRKDSSPKIRDLVKDLSYKVL